MQVTCDTCGTTGNEDDLAFDGDPCPDEDCDGTCYATDDERADHVTENIDNGNWTDAAQLIRDHDDPPRFMAHVLARLDNDDVRVLTGVMERHRR